MTLELWPRRIFPLFDRLPPEIQNLIWQTAVYSVKPRIVEVKENVAPSARQSTYSRKRQFISTCPIPGVLHACRASRSLALNRWRLAFAARYQPAKIFFDFSCDTLFFPLEFGNMSSFTNSVDATDLQAVTRIAFSLLYQWGEGYYHDGFELGVNLKNDFPALTQVLFLDMDLDAFKELEAKFRRRSKRLKSRPETPKPKRDPRKTIIRYRGHDVEALIEDEGDTVDEFMASCQAQEWTCPNMGYADYYRADLGELEFNEDERRYGLRAALRNGRLL